MAQTQLTRQAIAAAIDPLGWRLVLGSLRTFIAVASLAEATDVAARIVAACGEPTVGSLRLDLRPDGVLAALQSPQDSWVTGHEIALAGRIHAAVAELGRSTSPGGALRQTQVIELAIDALDASAIRAFWLAVLGYLAEPGNAGPAAPIVDPYGQSPTIWFQQMHPPRPQRNRIHFDVAVPPEEAPARIQAALAAGGTLRDDGSAPAFWVLADAEGNEACICTWQGRDG